jgi:hypothetical protein
MFDMLMVALIHYITCLFDLMNAKYGSKKVCFLFNKGMVTGFRDVV